MHSSCTAYTVISITIGPVCSVLDEFEELQHTHRPGHILWVPPSNSCVNPWQIVFDDLDSLLVVIQKKITCCHGG